MQGTGNYLATTIFSNACWLSNMQERMNGIESKHRNRPVEENAAVFEDMVVANERGKKHCLRFKIDMQALNKALRDPVAYRCNLTPHWRTKADFKVGAALSLQCCIDFGS